MKKREKMALNNSSSVFSTYGGPLNVDLSFKRSWLGRKAVLATEHLPNFRNGKLAGLVLPVDSLDDIRTALAEIAESNGDLVLAVDAPSILATPTRKSFSITLCACYKTIEEDLGKIAFLRQLGVRFFTYSSNRRNLLADGCGERKPGGLSHLGVNAAKEMERCGIIPDVSHLCDESFWDLLENTQGPVVATHSNTRALCANPRNLTDSQIKAIGDRGGFIGISTFPTLVAEHNPSVEVLVRHIDHIAEIAGIESVAIGTDLIDFLGSLFDASLARADPGKNLYNKELSSPVTAGIGCYGEVHNLIDALAAHGYTAEQVGMVGYKNMARVMARVP
jgi:membrane dipeptidase